MNDTIDPYKAPTSSLEKPSVAAGQHAYFFTTSTLKLVLMSVCTLGLYELYWFYKNWVLIKARTGRNMMPFWRAFFAPLWAYSCFKEMKMVAAENRVEGADSLSPGGLAIAYFVISALWRLPDPYWIVSMLSFLPLITANNLALQVNNRLVSGFKNNENFSGWNIVGMVAGGSLFMLSLADTFL